MMLSNIIRVDTPFIWGIIEIDPDDNKFVDTGLVAGADCIVTFDVHFNVVKSHPFPAITILNPDDFLALISYNRYIK